MARKERKKVIAYAVETDYGVDAIEALTLGAKPNYLLGREFSITPMAGESSELDYDDGRLGNSGEIVTELYVTVEFTVDFASSGDAAMSAPWGELMSACLRETQPDDDTTPTQHDYLINDESEGSLTLYFYQSGVLHKMTGSRGSLSLNVQAKNFGGIKFSFSGLFAPVEAADLPTADFTPWQTPLKIGVENSAFTIDGESFKLISMDYDQANSVVYQEYVGHEEVLITDFKPTGTIVLEAPKLDESDPFAMAKAGSKHELVFTNGPIGNQVEWSSPEVQFGRPTYADQDGTQTYSIPIIVIGNSDKFTTR